MTSEGYCVDPPTIRFWGESDPLVLTPFTDADFVDFNMTHEDLNGVQAKAWVRDRNGTAWLLKSGALGDANSKRPSPDEEKSRRAAFPVHESIVAMLLRNVDVGVSDVDLAFRTLCAVDEPRPLRLLVSAHRLLHGRRRDKVDAFQPPASFADDLFVSLCINVVIGQRDHESHNYLVGDDGHFIPIDNSGCMYGDWFTTDLSASQFNNIRSLEPQAPVSTEAIWERVRHRLKPLTTEVVDAVFAALPPEAIAWHDTAVGIGHYAPGTLAQKQARVRKNVEALRHWVGHE